tara:strand:- start:229 stop:804 length:576 start_codon:yes stop_codon:yes gene_type:complete
MKSHIRSGWTTITNALIDDKSLNGDGMRLISWISSHNGSYKVTRAGIAKALGLGECKMRKAIKQAKDAGYLRIVNDQCEKTGQFKSRYEVFTDGRFATNGKSTGIRINNITAESTRLEAEFLGIFPAAPVDFNKYRFRLNTAVEHFGLEYVIVEAKRYAIDVASRTKGGGIAKPENWLYRLRWPDCNEVIE